MARARHAREEGHEQECWAFDRDVEDVGCRLTLLPRTRKHAYPLRVGAQVKVRVRSGLGLGLGLAANGLVSGYEPVLRIQVKVAAKVAGSMGATAR